MNKRKHPAHHPVVEQTNRSPIIFLTVCAKNRNHILANPEVHKLMLRSWKQAHFWSVGRYVIMPDHIHLFCTPAVHEFPALGKWVQYWKALASKSWPRPKEQPIWQASFWDTQLRQHESYTEKWHYVRNNPVRAGLVTDAGLWPYQGEIETLFWHD